MQYCARITPADSRLLVDFPDCPGCQTFGRTHREALARGKEALEGWLEAHLVTGDAPPRPRLRRPVRGRTAMITVPPILGVRLALRWARHESGLSQGDLAKRIGVTRQQVALLESPDSNVTLRTLEKVARAMNLELDIRLVHAQDSAA